MYLSVKEVAIKWNLSQRSVRNYCAKGCIEGSYLQGKVWLIPIDAKKPQRKNSQAEKRDNLLRILQSEQKNKISGGIYHKIQVDLTYNSNHIEGSKLSHDETRYIFETNTIGSGEVHSVDDIIETANHFRCIDMVIVHATSQLCERFIKQLHSALKSGTSDSRKDWFAVGGYKKLPNQVGGKNTTSPAETESAMADLISAYNSKSEITFEDIVQFHHDFECIHPFQDGNGRIGRLIMFKECLKQNIVPFIISDEHKMYYYRGLNQWETERGFLLGTCGFASDVFKTYLDYFEVPYKK